MPIILTFFVFSFSLLSFSFPLLFSFFLFYFFLLCSSSVFFDLLFWAQWRSFYSACCDQILLFCPLTTFVWSGCTCRPPLVRLHHPPQLQTKKKAVLFIGLPWRPFLPRCRCFLSLWHAPNGFFLNLASFGWFVIPARRTSQKSLGRSCKIGIFPSSYHQTIPPYL